MATFVATPVTTFVATSEAAVSADTVLRSAAVLLLVARLAAVWTEARLRAPGWPLLRCGPTAYALLLHDVLVGWICLAALGGLGRWVARHAGLPESAATSGAVAACLLGAALSEALLRRRRGVGLRSLLRPRHRVAEPVPTVRRRLLDAVEFAGVRQVARWIDGEIDRGLDRNGGGVDQLLPALWPGVRLALREVPGVPRTEVGLLLLQAQAVMDDASPARDRILTLLHLVHARAGRAGVRAALEQARRSPVRHGRTGPAVWSASPDALPRPVAPTSS
jgi:hypothetical protein